MINIIDCRKEKNNLEINKLLNRTQLDFSGVNDTVSQILMDVKSKGDNGLIKYTEKFDCENIKNIIVSKKEIDKGYSSCQRDFIEALETSKKNIEDYHRKELKNSWIDNSKDGIMLGQLYNPISKVGLYIPGGTAPYPSTLLMCAVPAQIAGVKEIVLISPPSKDGSINNKILAAAKVAGIEKIFKAGGAQGIGALAYGTETVPKVDKIVGPGNIYVTMAKRMVYGYVDIDMIAGPSEILIIADDEANSKFIAADMLSQAEHDNLASSILITTSEKIASEVKEDLSEQMSKLSRNSIMKDSISNFGAIVIVNDLKEAFTLSNEIAPEHLELMIKSPFENLNNIKNAGAIFIGEYSPEPLGDYFAGPNHTLPTSGTAKFFSPLGVDDFIKKSSIIYYNKKSLINAKDKIIRIAEEEGLTAHANSIRIRCE
ncbi:histidinol dehydrogenase [Dethiothermospora halolimnae]|uniref:histidinol dehydrogenase n=1 Tax=Dethiothermospora halolimnae TaxID=3114390 RepID=UPI003CCBC3D9